MASSSGEKEGAVPAALLVEPKDTIFAKMVSGAIPCKRVYEDETAMAIHDISPQAPTHVLIISKEYAIPNLHDAIDVAKAAGKTEQDITYHLGHLLVVAGKVASVLGVDSTGYRLIINSGAHGQQSVNYLHMHLLAGRQMTWPPG